MTDAYAYRAFGAAWQGGNGSTNAYRYAGEYGYYRDSAAVQYVRARYLNVVQGRWMSADPLRFEAGDYNLYRYVGNEPVGRMDASGLECDALKPTLKEQLSKCFKSPYDSLLATAFACIAEAESSCYPGTKTGGNYGLLQLGPAHLRDCGSDYCGVCPHDRKKPPEDWKSVGCQTHTAVTLLYTFCSDNPNITLCDALAAYWGTVRAQRNNVQFWQCITKAQCKSIKNTKCSAALKGVCTPCKYPYPHLKYRCKSDARVPQCSKV